MTTNPDQSIGSRGSSGWITNAGIYVIASALEKGVAYLLLPLWAQFLVPADFGIVGTMAVYSGLLIVLLQLGLASALLRLWSEKATDPAQGRALVSSVFLLQMGVAVIVVGGLALFGERAWATWTAGKIAFSPYVELMLWTSCLESILLMPIVLYQARHQAMLVLAAQGAKFVLGVGCSAYLVIGLRWGAYGVLLGQLLSAAAVASVFWVVTLLRSGSVRLSAPLSRAALAFGVPVVPHLVAMAILHGADRAILEKYVSLSELGQYNVGYTAGMVLMLMNLAFQRAWYPQYYDLMAAKKRATSFVLNSASSYVAVAASLSFACILLSVDAIYLLLPGQYHPSAVYVPAVVLSALLMGYYGFALAPVMFHKKTGWMPLLTSTAAAANVLLNLWLIPRWGALAAAWNTVAGYAVLFLLYGYVGRRYERPRYPFWRIALISLPVVGSSIVMTRYARFELGWLPVKLLLSLGFAGLCYRFIWPRERAEDD